LRRSSRTQPGWTVPSLPSGSMRRTWCMYLEKSITTATLQHWPARLVPQPRPRTGAPWRRAAATVSTTAAPSRGVTTPMGAWRELEPSVGYRARLPPSNRPSPLIFLRSSAASRQTDHGSPLPMGVSLSPPDQVAVGVGPLQLQPEPRAGQVGAQGALDRRRH